MTFVLSMVEADDHDPTRQYIPLPGDWEIQTKGRGSTYRLLNRKTGERHAILSGDIKSTQDFVTKMALEIHAETRRLQLRINEYELLAERRQR